MNVLSTPTKTPIAAQWLDAHPSANDRIKRVLLSKIDGHRNVIELESFARAIGLPANALERLRAEGLIEANLNPADSP